MMKQRAYRQQQQTDEKRRAVPDHAAGPDDQRRSRRLGWAEVIAGLALIVAFSQSVVQCSDRDIQYQSQLFAVRAESQRKVISATENLSSLRQELMVVVETNIFDPAIAATMTQQEMVADAKRAAPIFVAIGAFRGAIQGELAFWQDRETRDALIALDTEGAASVRCFTELGSRSHPLEGDELKWATSLIADACRSGNQPTSLVKFSAAEGRAIRAMMAETKQGDNGLLPKLSLWPL